MPDTFDMINKFLHPWGIASILMGLSFVAILCLMNPLSRSLWAGLAQCDCFSVVIHSMHMIKLERCITIFLLQATVFWFHHTILIPSAQIKSLHQDPANQLKIVAMGSVDLVVYSESSQNSSAFSVWPGLINLSSLQFQIRVLLFAYIQCHDLDTLEA